MSPFTNLHYQTNVMKWENFYETFELNYQPMNTQKEHLWRYKIYIKYSNQMLWITENALKKIKYERRRGNILYCQYF